MQQAVQALLVLIVLVKLLLIIVAKSLVRMGVQPMARISEDLVPAPGWDSTVSLAG